MNKICIKCKITIKLELFSKDKTRKDGLHPYCKECVKISSKIYFDSHRKEAAANTREWYQENKNKIKERRSTEESKKNKSDYMKIYRALNKETKRRCSKEYEQRRCKEDINYKLAIGLRKRLCVAIKEKQKQGSAVADLGCSIDFFKLYIENLFKPGMSWDNWGMHGWHLDHIRPLSSFDLTDREQFLKACHYTNLQPLWALENLQKSSKYSTTE